MLLAGIFFCAIDHAINAMEQPENKNDLEFIAYTPSLTDDQKKERIILLLKNGANPFAPVRMKQESFFSKIISFFKPKDTLYTYYPIIKETYDAYAVKKRQEALANILVMIQSKNFPEEKKMEIMQQLPANYPLRHTMNRILERMNQRKVQEET